MGVIGRVIKSYIEKLSGSGTNAQVSSVEELAGDPRTVQHFGPCNEDFSPPINCRTYDVGVGRDKGYLIAISYHNQLIPPVAVAGEKRAYSTNESGDAIKSEIFLKQDGTILIDNGSVTITADPSGRLEILTTGNSEITSAKTIINNDLDINGNLKVTGTSTLISATTIQAKPFLTHSHGGVSTGTDSTGGVV